MENGRGPLQFFVDQPSNWLAIGRHVIIRGWCFAAAGNPVRAVRLRCSGVTFSGVVGLPRPDVKAALPGTPDNNTGFEIRGTLPAGRQSLSLEAQLPDGSWQPFLVQKVQVKGSWLPRWLGGGSARELIAFQMPAHMAYPPRGLKQEKFPASHSPAARAKLSIVTPSYQQARFLEQTMRSVLEQTGIDCQYVVQDGGSTDGTQQLLAAVENSTSARPADSPIPSSPPHSAQNMPRAFSWESARDNGQTEAIVRGFAKTRGAPDDLMAWINSDDFYLPGALAFVTDYFARHPEADVIYGHRILVDEDSQEIARWFMPKHEDEVLRLNDFVPQETMFWRRRIWEKAGGLDASFKFAMDWDLLLRFQAAGAKIIRVPYFLACFRIHPVQKTSAQMAAVGQAEIDALRLRTFGRVLPPAELESHPRLLRYLRRSAFVEFLWKLGLRVP